ncbi:recombinase family protein [Alkalibacter sp. M17DMB]|nr:recombinase family protein [Alkalibacter mobilis]
MAAYCRVSTESQEQRLSFYNQVNYYQNYINSKADYQLVDIYADDGVSGTETKKRDAFKEMMQKAKEGYIDLIITKSLSRFGRNTL